MAATSYDSGSYGAGKSLAPRDIYDRQPPCDLDAERALLGSLLLRPDVIDEVLLLLRADDFFDPTHGTIFHHMAAVHDLGRRIDPTLLADMLSKAGDFEKVGGLATLAELAQAVPTAANAEYYGKIIREKSVYRALIKVGTDIVQSAYNQEFDYDHLLGQAEMSIFAVREGRGTGEQLTIGEILHNVMERIDARLAGTAVDDGVETGFADFDNLSGGLHNSELAILAARPSMGKTAMAMNIAEHVSIELSLPVLFVSLEMASIELGNRLLCSHAKVNSQHLRNDSLSGDERRSLVEAASKISQAPLVVDDTPSRTMSEISAVARRLKRRDGLGLIVIDYLQLIEPDNPKDPRQEQVSKIARRLKHLAREMDVPVLCLSQLNRQAEASKDNRPKLSHLRESGAIEQDADVVMFVHREEYYATSEEEREPLKGQAEIIIAKQRNGPIGEVPLTWLHQYTRFESKAKAHYDEFSGGEF